MQSKSLLTGCNMSNSRLSLLSVLLLVSSLETIEVSAWVPASRNNLPSSRVFNPRHVVTTVYSAVEETTEILVVDSATSQEQRISAQMPKIKYTVPGMKLGWKENGVWMDQDGPRNGPPQNYWRQNADERVFGKSVDLIQELLKSAEAQGEKDVDILEIDAFNEMIDRLERTNSIRTPSLNRMVLGDWAPILRGGKIIASNTGEEESFDIPYRFRIQRTAGQKLAPKTNYGIFDEHLEAGEEVTVEEISSSNTVTSTGTFLASPDQKENVLVKGYNNAIDGDLYLGCVTYLTKYVMIMRKPLEQADENSVTKGPITEIWTRLDLA